MGTARIHTLDLIIFSPCGTIFLSPVTQETAIYCFLLKKTQSCAKLYEAMPPGAVYSTPDNTHFWLVLQTCHPCTK